MLRSLLILCILCFSTPSVFAQQSTDSVHDMQIRYLVSLPEKYQDSLRTFPLMVFLHGSGERGNDLNLIKHHGPPKVIEKGMKIPFIIISPQCPADQWWQAAQVKLVLDDVRKKYRVDINRIYITGLSMGGFGTWDFATTYPEIPAAIIPICGGGDPSKADRLKKIPAKVYHGAKDDVVPLHQSESMVKAMERQGGQVSLTVYPNAGHDSWTEAYNDKQLYIWLSEHKKATIWDKDFAKYKADERKNKPFSEPTLFVGSSAIKNWPYLESTYRNQRAVVRGFKGFTFGDMNDYFYDWILRYKPKTIVLYAGDNDLASGKYVNQIVRDFDALFIKIRTYLPETKVIVISVKPSPVRRKTNKTDEIIQLNARLQEYLSKKNNTQFIDVYSKMVDRRNEPNTALFMRNGLYLNKEGYKLWQKELSAVLLAK